MESGKVQSHLVYGKDMEQLLNLAFKFAENGKFVWFISPVQITSLSQSLPTPDRAVLKHITILYLKEKSDLLNHLHSVEIWHRTPELIIVNNFHYYSQLDTDEYKPTEAAFLCTSLLNAGKATASKLNKTIHLVASIDLEKCKNTEDVQILLDLYFDYVTSCKDINL